MAAWACCSVAMPLAGGAGAADARVTSLTPSSYLVGGSSREVASIQKRRVRPILNIDELP